MHEFSVTSQIVDAILKEAKKHNAKRVMDVYLDIGKLTFLGLEQVRFSYEILVKGTIMEGSKLYIEEKDGTVNCRSCGYEGSFQYEDDPIYHIPTPTLRCPNCGETVEIKGGRECTIRDIKLLISEDDKTDAD